MELAVMIDSGGAVDVRYCDDYDEKTGALGFEASETRLRMLASAALGLHERTGTIQDAEQSA